MSGALPSLSARGVRVPVAVTLFVAALPWLVGIAGASASLGLVADPVTYAHARSREVIQRVVRGHVTRVRYGYERELARNPSPAGTVTVGSIIAPDGRVRTSSISSSTLDSPPVEQCVAAAVRRWRFPAPDGGGIVVVAYPFRFESAGSDVARQDELPVEPPHAVSQDRLRRGGPHASGSSARLGASRGRARRRPTNGI